MWHYELTVTGKRDEKGNYKASEYLAREIMDGITRGVFGNSSLEGLAQSIYGSKEPSVESWLSLRPAQGDREYIITIGGENQEISYREPMPRQSIEELLFHLNNLIKKGKRVDRD